MAPDLVRRFRSASSAELRRAMWVAATAAVRSAEVDEDYVRLGLDNLRSGSSGDAALRERLLVLAEELDEEYWTLNEEFESETASGERCLTAFRKARAVWSVYYGVDMDVLRGAFESVYEAYSAVGEDEDGDRVLAMVEECLRRSL